MALSELDDLLNDLEKTVEEERGLGKVILYIKYIHFLKFHKHLARPYL